MIEINKREETNRLCYSLQEDQRILRYVLDGNHQDFIKGDGLWKKMEMERVCGSRTWQSMKNRFMRNILASKSRPEYGLTHEEKQSLKNINQSTATSNLKKNCEAPYENDGWKALEAEKVCSGRSWQSMKNRFLRDIYPSIINPIYDLTEEEIAWITNCLSSKPNSELNNHNSFVEILSSSDESLDAIQIESDTNIRSSSKRSHEIETYSSSSTRFCRKSAYTPHSAKVLNPFAKSASTVLKKSQRNSVATKTKVNNKNRDSLKKSNSIHVASSSKNWESVDSLVSLNSNSEYVHHKNEVEVLRVSSSDTDECSVIPNDFYSIDMKWTDSDTS
ncbi:uncharacterized protein [Euwallacea fornicatus]|uniref:uncharacterized protein isoform X3 n=1 Tax=Euwallacea fornicatus TaxID=995702 RepID=UPI00338E8388